ncbi:MAG: 3-isopropylmalate dehydratase small subunit [Planctomycetaceae bacterium]|nr:3-isopropylmalate dehydratase small subunit [Planctomycetaceae bacterium]MCA9030793.1 3-isopropylmalate dehydratase small subunit [Planctomycetaceae bacterium]MCB9954144.1 3-isopropylmalate dehydratase small subunit [Planctomycetaceae bacterium]
MNKIESVSGTGIPLLLDDIDTDRIIPARFLRCVSFDGLGEHAFEDDRQQDPSHPFNNDVYQNASVLVSGRNFGCGSSREHAPQSLMRWGIQAVVAESFAEIFFGNCIGLGIPVVTASREDLQRLNAAIKANPELAITVDLVAQQITFGEETCACQLPESARDALTTGQWDFLGQLLDNKEAIAKTVESLPYM